MAVTTAERSEWGRAWLAFLVFLVPLGLWQLGSTDIVMMEGIVADGARHMESSGELWVPRLHGEIYAYKPPMVYWMALASSRVLGESEWAIRLPFALSGLLMAAVVLWVVGRRFDPWAGWLCGAASLTGIMTIQRLRLAEFDMPLTAGVGIAAVLAMDALTSRTVRFWQWPGVYLALLFAFLAKGVPALMFFGPGLLLAAWVTSTWRRLFSWAHVLGGLLFVAGVGLWIWLSWRAEGMAAFEQALNEADAKGLSWTLEAVGRTLLKPLEAMGLFLPWTLALPLLLKRSQRTSWSHEARTWMLASGAFAVAGVAIFMLVPATENRYLAPLAVPLGVLCGLLLSQAATDPETKSYGLRLGRWATAGIGGILLIASPTLVVLGELDIPLVNGILLSLVGLGMLIMAWRMPRLGFPRVSRLAGLLGALAVGLWAVHVWAVTPHRTHSRTLGPLAEQFRPHVAQDGPLWAGPVRAEYKHSSLVYYLERPITTFPLDQPPPVGSRVILFSDETPGFDAAPMSYRVLEESTRRGVRIAIVEVTN